jgi:hypothetical protein
MEKNFSDLSAYFSEQLKRSAVMISSPGKHDTGSIFKYYVSLFVVCTKPTIGDKPSKSFILLLNFNFLIKGTVL